MNCVSTGQWLGDSELKKIKKFCEIQIQDVNQHKKSVSLLFYQKMQEADQKAQSYCIKMLNCPCKGIRKDWITQFIQNLLMTSQIAQIGIIDVNKEKREWDNGKPHYTVDIV